MTRKVIETNGEPGKATIDFKHPIAFFVGLLTIIAILSGWAARWYDTYKYYDNMNKILPKIQEQLGSQDVLELRVGQNETATKENRNEIAVLKTDVKKVETKVEILEKNK